MPVISTRYSTTTTTGNTYLSPSVGTYRSTLSATSRSSADRAASIERPNYTSATESYLNRSRATSSTFRLSSTTSSYRLTNGTSSGSSGSNSSDSYSSRYGVSNIFFWCTYVLSLSPFHDTPFFLTPARSLIWWWGSSRVALPKKNRCKSRK